MSDGLDVIILDDDPDMCALIAKIIERFYTWGEVHAFTDVEEAAIFCLNRDSGLAIFIVDVFLGGKSGFLFLDSLAPKYHALYEDTVMITGNASDDVVNMCVASDVCYLLEKPIRPFALQLAVKAIATKYMKFGKKLLEDPSLAEMVAKF
jgi:DNA-binding NtrC family response regulator